MTILQIDDVSKHFGALAAIEDVSFAIETGERVALVGPNGAGKTTLFNLVCGELAPDEGKIRLDGRDVTRRSPENIARSGLGRTFQRNSLFLEGTVYENVRLAVQGRKGVRYQMLRSVERYPRLREGTEEVLGRIGLADRSEVKAAELSYGEQRQLELGVTLAAAPRVLLLDEPTAGMSAKETHEIVAMLKSLPETVALLIVEHDMDVVTALAHRIVVLNFGRIIADGTPDEVRKNEEVLAAYLGTGPEELQNA